MANTKSVQKRARQSVDRGVDNRAAKTRVRSARKALASAIAKGDKDAAQAQWRQFASAADRAAKRGAIHKNSASRLKGLYARRVASIG